MILFWLQKQRSCWWKSCINVRGVWNWRVLNIGKTKIMRCQERIGQAEESGKYPCGVCRQGVGDNSIKCVACHIIIIIIINLTSIFFFLFFWASLPCQCHPPSESVCFKWENILDKNKFLSWLEFQTVYGNSETIQKCKVTKVNIIVIR